jgi:hypothetical protein
MKKSIPFVLAICLTAMLNYTRPADASPVNPLNDVQSSSPIDTILFPSGYGSGTGAGGNTLSNTWYASTSDGWLLKYDGKTFQNAIDTGYQLTGVDVRPDGTLVLSHNMSLEIGTVTGNTWNNISTISLIGLTSDTTDVSEGYGMADFFVASGNGVYAVRNGVLGESVGVGGLNAYDVVRLDPTKYTSNLVISDATQYANADLIGHLNGGSVLIDLNLDDNPLGVANLKDYQMIVESGAFQVYNPQGFAPGIQNIPEPASISLTAVGLMSLLARRKEEKQ